MAANAPLQRPMASDDFLGQTEWTRTPTAPITDAWQHLDAGVFTPDITDQITALEANQYILINLYRDTIPDNFAEAIELKINLYFSGFNLGSDPVVMFWLYTDYPTFLVRQIGAPKKMNLLFAGQTAGGITMPFYDPPPSEDELKKTTLLIQSATGVGGTHDPPYDPP